MGTWALGSASRIHPHRSPKSTRWVPCDERIRERLSHPGAHRRARECLSGRPPGQARMTRLRHILMRHLRRSRLGPELDGGPRPQAKVLIISSLKGGASSVSEVKLCNHVVTVSVVRVETLAST